MGEVSKGAIVVVAKAPQVGKVKTRLCPPLNYEQAAALYTGFLLDTIEIALRVADCDVKVVCPSAQDALELQQILPASVGYVVQQTPGLTTALTQAIEECLSLGYQKVFCISSDNPTLPTRYLETAVSALDTSDLVFGPTEDGGYYLIGASASCPYLFEGMIWSTETVLAETLERAFSHRASFQLMPGWYDLDTGQELARFIRELPEQESQARHTRQALALLDYRELLDVAG
jgi:rSAM/selenodomain-associated transferase 1